MPDLSRLPHKLDPKKRTCRAIIETPRESRMKLDFDAKHRVFRIKTLLPDGMTFPLDFGFVPSTLAGDGDPLDVMVLIDQPCPTGAMLEVRLLGLIAAEEVEKGKRERNDRVLAAACVSRLYAKVQTPDDLGDEYVTNLVDFWINKAKLEGKQFHCLGVEGPDKAVEAVKAAAEALKKKG